MTDERVGVYPGSFNPPTIAHLAIADAARLQRSLDRVVLMVSHLALGKGRIERPTFAERIDVIRASIDSLPWLDVQTTELRLLADLAEGFDVVIMGADKWHQINELRWYDSEAHRRASLDRLPDLAVAPRPPLAVPPEHALDIGPEHADVSSSRARAGARHLMTPAARAHAEATGAWLGSS